MNTYSGLRAQLQALILTALVMGCAGQSAQPTPVRPVSTAARHGYALLFELVAQQKDVAKLLIIKKERDELDKLITEIGEICKAAHGRLQELAEADPSLELEDNGLPKAEIEAREVITAARTKALLAASGEEFELQLLLAQNEALTYLTALTEVLARAEPDTDRLEFLRTFWKDLHGLHLRVMALIRASYRWTP